MSEIARRHSEILRIKSLSPEAIFQKTRRVKESFIDWPIHKGLDGYPYSLFPLTDGPIDPSLVEDMADLIIHSDKRNNFEKADILVSEGDRGGGLLAQAIGTKTGIPITLANWHATPPDVPGMVSVKTTIGFSGHGDIAIYGIQPGQNAIVVDDLLSTGGTSKALFEAILKMGANIEEAFFVGEKVNLGGRQNILQRFPNITVTSFARFISEEENGVTIDADL